MNHLHHQNKASIARTVVIVVAVIVIIVAAAGTYVFLQSGSSTSTFTSTSTTTSSSTSSSSSGIVTTSSSQGPIVIGMVTHLSGPLESVGVSQSNGANLAVAQLNANGGILGRQVQLFIKDEGASSSDALTSVQSLLSTDHADFMICCALSGDASAAIPTLQQANIVSICALCSLNSLFVAPNNDLLFGTSLPDSGYATGALAWLQLIGAKNYMYVGESYSFVADAEHYIGNASSAAGIQLAAPPSYFSSSTTDFSSLINNIAATHPSAVMVEIVGGEVVDFAEQYANNPAVSKIPVLYIDTLLAQRFFANEVQTAVPNGMNNVFLLNPNTFTNVTATYVKTYEAKYNISSSYLDQDTYVSIMVMANAMERAGSLNSSALVNALLTTNYVGPDGVVLMQSNHLGKIGTGYLSGTLYQYQLTSGSLHYQVIWPPDYANATAVIP